MPVIQTFFACYCLCCMLRSFSYILNNQWVKFANTYRSEAALSSLFGSDSWPTLEGLFIFFAEGSTQLFKTRCWARGIFLNNNLVWEQSVTVGCVSSGNEGLYQTKDHQFCFSGKHTVNSTGFRGRNAGTVEEEGKDEERSRV